MMKKYTTEEIYILTGRDDKTASVQFIPGTESYKKYGSYTTVIFLYTQDEREAMDEMIKTEPFTHSGMVRAQYLLSDIGDDLIKELKDVGIKSDDIWDISYFKGEAKNTYHSKELRTIKKIPLTIKAKPKGRDYDWVFGFQKKLASKGIGMTPQQRNFYLALKVYYDKDDLTDEEKKEINTENNELKECVYWEYLQIKLHREEITEDETKQLGILLNSKKSSDMAILDKYLKQAGSSLKKLTNDNIDQAVNLLLKVGDFKDRKLNVMGKIPVYLDIDGFLHVYMRHVEEMKVNAHFEHKDNFQWATDDVLTVMEHVIKEIDEEVQAYFIERPKGRYSRYGNQSVYFEGDYYTLHIEPNGRISTFHKNSKNKAEAVDVANKK
jgi:hypothetical protein